MYILTRIIIPALLALMLVACDSSDDPAQETESAAAPEAGIDVAEWQQQGRDDFDKAASDWQAALAGLEQSPGDAQLKTLRESLAGWYQAFTMQALPLNARACQLDQHATLSRMDTWPLYPGYIDAMPEWPESGLISDPYLEMDGKTLRLQHGATDEAEASLGFAAMFVVLNGTGDTAKALSFFQGEENQAARRLSYLKLAGEQIIRDYRVLMSEAPLSDSDLDCALSKMLREHQKLKESADNDNELVIPATVRQTLGNNLLVSLQNVPESVVQAWNDARPGILDTLAASKKDGWQVIEAWQEGDRSTPEA